MRPARTLKTVNPDGRKSCRPSRITLTRELKNTYATQLRLQLAYKDRPDGDSQFRHTNSNGSLLPERVRIAAGRGAGCDPRPYLFGQRSGSRRGYFGGAAHH